MLVRERRRPDRAGAASTGTGVVSYGPLGVRTADRRDHGRHAVRRGRLARSDESDDPDDGDLFAADVLPACARHRRRLRPIAERLGVTLAQLALAWNVAPAGRHERDRRQPQPRPRAVKRRRGRHRARRGRRSPSSTRCSTLRVRARERAVQPERSTWRSRRTMPSSSLSVDLRLVLQQATAGAGGTAAAPASGVTGTTEARPRATVDRGQLAEEVPGQDLPTFACSARPCPRPRARRTASRRASPSRTIDLVPARTISSSVSAARRCRCFLREVREHGHRRPAQPRSDAACVARGCSGWRRTAGRTRAAQHVGKALAHASKPTPSGAGRDRGSRARLVRCEAGR